jgi:hypothetical protein
MKLSSILRTHNSDMTCETHNYLSFLLAGYEMIVHCDVRQKTTMIMPKIRYRHTKFNHPVCVHNCQKV